MREDDQHLVDNLVVSHSPADRRYHGIAWPLPDEVVAIELPELRGSETACHRRHD